VCRVASRAAALQVAGAPGPHLPPAPPSLPPRRRGAGPSRRAAP
jgi:hypothetical protein